MSLTRCPRRCRPSGLQMAAPTLERDTGCAGIVSGGILPAVDVKLDAQLAAPRSPTSSRTSQANRSPSPTATVATSTGSRVMPVVDAHRIKLFTRTYLFALAGLPYLTAFFLDRSELTQLLRQLRYDCVIG